MALEDDFFAGIGQRAKGSEEFVVDAWGLGRSMGLDDVTILNIVEGLASEGLITERTVHGGDIIARLTPKGVAQWRQSAAS